MSPTCQKSSANLTEAGFCCLWHFLTKFKMFHQTKSLLQYYIMYHLVMAQSSRYNMYNKPGLGQDNQVCCLVHLACTTRPDRMRTAILSDRYESSDQIKARSSKLLSGPVMAWSQGITLRPCLVHLHIWTPNFSILAYEFSLQIFISIELTNLSLKIPNFISLYAEMGKLGHSNTCTRQGLKAMPYMVY